jgi:TIR domain
MKRIEKINLVDRIGRELQSKFTYSEISAYLSDFNVDVNKKTTDEGGSKWVYVKDLLGTEPNEVIIEIADELEIIHEYENTNVKTIEKLDSKFWRPNHFRLFLSHLSSFKEKTSQLQKNLLNYGISSFVAHEDIEPTQEWLGEIEKALFSMDALAAILMPGFEESNWTDQEVGVAVGRDVLVIPIRRGKDPYGFIGKYQGMQANGKSIGSVSEEIFKILSNHHKTKNNMAGCIADQIILSNDSEEAIKKCTLLRLRHTPFNGHTILS